MKMRNKGLSLALAAVLLVLTAATAFAAPNLDSVGFHLDNRSGSTVTLTLKGEGTRTVTVGAGENREVQLEEGEYFYRYTACGITYSGKFSTDTSSRLILKKCPGVAYSNIVLDNRTGSPFIISLRGLSGQLPYSFWVPANGMNIRVLAGGYAFSSNACNVDNGTVKASASLQQPLIWTFKCGSQSIAPSVAR
jgi:hypothetical protein